MKNEIKQSVLNPINIVYIVAIVLLMLANSYYGGWKTGLNAAKSTDILLNEDKLFFAQYYGNTFRVWFGAYPALSIFLPIILVVPYCLSYRNEISNRFRYMMYSRTGQKRYARNKLVAIVLSGVIVVISAELIFYIITYAFTYPLISEIYLENIVSYDHTFFTENPFKYFGLILSLRLGLYIFFAIFSVGVTTFMKSKIAILGSPFILNTILDSIVPHFMKPHKMVLIYSSYDFSILGYVALLCIYGLIGLVFYYAHESKIAVQGL